MVQHDKEGAPPEKVVTTKQATRPACAVDNNPESAIQPPTLPHSPPSTLNLHKSPPLASTTIIVSKVQEVFRNLTNEIKWSPYFSRSYLEHSAQQLHVVMPAPLFTSIHNQTAPHCVQASKGIFLDSNYGSPPYILASLI